jgi:hypothetical protein
MFILFIVYKHYLEMTTDVHIDSTGAIMFCHLLAFPYMNPNKITQSARSPVTGYVR